MCKYIVQHRHYRTQHLCNISYLQTMETCHGNWSWVMSSFRKPRTSPKPLDTRVLQHQPYVIFLLSENERENDLLTIDPTEVLNFLRSSRLQNCHRRLLEVLPQTCKCLKYPVGREKAQKRSSGVSTNVRVTCQTKNSLICLTYIEPLSLICLE